MSKEEASGSVQNLGGNVEPAWPVYQATGASDFLEILVASSAPWHGTKRGDIIYRGQSIASWGLVPRAFRRGEVKEGLGKSGRRRVGSQARAEFRAVHEFLSEADAVGLQITERGGQLLLQENPAVLFGRDDWEIEWPQEAVWEAIALAQHHGVVTRFLDFTESELVAAFWAAFDAWQERDRREESLYPASHIAVWVVDLRFVRAINTIKQKFPERIAVIRVPRGSNAYLHAQEGLFLIDRGANDVLAFEDRLSLESIIAMRAQYWLAEDRLKHAGIDQTWFGDVPVAQVCLPSECVVDLLKELKTRGISIGRLMPSLDRVVEALSTDRLIAEAH